MYDQLRAPNLSTVGYPEECLVYVRNVYGIPSKYATAALGWEYAAYRHVGEQPPSDVSVPVWFKWGTEGHVAVWVPGVGIYSTTAQGVKIFGSIQALINYIGGGIEYLGWSEDVDGTRVVQPAVVPAPVNNHDETVKAGTWYVRNSPSVSGTILGTIGGGLVFATVITNDWRQINFNGRTGYVGPAAWEN